MQVFLPLLLELLLPSFSGPLPLSSNCGSLLFKMAYGEVCKYCAVVLPLLGTLQSLLPTFNGTPYKIM